MNMRENDAFGLREAFAWVNDPRRQSGNFRHMLLDILVIGFCAIATSGDGFNEMEDFGRAREGWLVKFLALPRGIPDADTFRRVFGRMNPPQLMECLQTWLCGTALAGGRQTNIDGKTMRGSARAGEAGARLVSAWVNEGSMTLGQAETEERGNEITAIPRLLDLLDIKGDTATIDAMGCQTEIAAKIHSKKGHYALAAKENQPTLHRETEEYFRRLDEGRVPRLPEDIWEGGHEKDHGRLERRRARAAYDIGFLSGRKKRKGLKTIIEYRSERTVLADGKTTSNTRYYISNRDCPAEEFARIIRGHWSIREQPSLGAGREFRGGRKPRPQGQLPEKPCCAEEDFPADQHERGGGIDFAGDPAHGIVFQAGI